MEMEEPDQELIQTSQEAETVYSEDQESNDPAEMENEPDEDEEDTEEASVEMLKNSEKREMLQNITKRKNQWKLQATKRLKMQANARRKMIEGKTYTPFSKQEALKATETASRIRPYKAPAWQSRQCGQCGPCKVVDDCRKCGFCLDRKRFGGRKELRQKCRLKQCIRLASIPPPAVDVSLVDHFFYIKRPEIDPETEEKENKGAEDMERQSESIEKQKEPENQPSKEERKCKQSQQKPTNDKPKSKHFLRSRTGASKGETSVAKPKTTEETTKAKETTKTKETTGRKALSIAAKVKIIQEFENRRTGRVLKRKVDIARKWGITPKRLAFILEKKGTLMEQFQHQCDAWEERKRTRKATIAEVEQAVLMWCKAASAMNIPLSGPLVQEKARALSKKMGRPDYPCNDGWWDCFKIQHSITFLAIAAQVREMVTDRSETGLNQVLEGYEPWDIFNADETGILYRRLPDRSLTCKGKTCNGGEGSEERLTAMVCANMDGSEKLPLLVIGKSKKPQCLANVKSLPMQYEANKTAWMTPDIFEAWAHNIDKLYQKKNRKIAIIVDICPAHPRITDFKSINLVFRPTITTAKLQPMKQGVIQNLKTHYRRQLITSFLAAVDKKEEYNPTVLDAMFLLQKAWKMVKESTISHGFKLAGFHNKKATAQNTETAEPDADINSATQDKDLFDQLRDAGMDIPRKVTLKSYAAVDANVRCTMELNDDAILDAVLAEANDVEDDDEPPVPPCPAVSIAKATRYLDKLRNFALQSEHTEGMFSAICDIEEVIGLVRKGEATRKRNTDVL
ncbi:tigger transposable element-derived protein 4-like [Patiria miniata]|uniref:Tigger transposable element-derived protein 4 n=1 Tax=Patiria miniata TaxID=46514 RepID=A0A914B124_PATMI|nr:tigger transposable element-derived protein 4-like [Patiria miniata]